ncbi:unnamed protein product [Strongylus vulgaris]|uniref:Uncharacterized protein n=1 Tax=Strongylus vulgaris TaxID=40348 RepID=A0A3P7JKT6_STRVU|nr:unnamed protein product [Strongylus vulgaris]
MKNITIIVKNYLPPAVGEIFAPAKYCNAETRKGILYPKTRACTEARLPCPDPENIMGTLMIYEFKKLCPLSL